MKIARNWQAVLVALLCTVAILAAYLLPNVGAVGPKQSAGVATTVTDGVTVDTAVNLTPARSIQKTIADFEKVWKPIDDGNSKSWVQAFVDAKVVPLGAGKLAPATFQTFTDGNRIMVRSGLSGTGVVEPSGISMIFSSETREVVQIVETTFVQGEGGGSVSTWIDGTKILDRFVPDLSASEKTITIGWNEFTACLNGAGVASWVITAITIACSAICLGTAGAGCIPCITAAAGITGGVFYSCAARGLFYS